MKQSISKNEFQSPELLNRLYKEIPELEVILNISGVWLAGGALRTLLDTTPFSSEVTDIDLFFKTTEIKKTLDGFLTGSMYWKKVFDCPLGTLTTFKNEYNRWKIQLISIAYYETVEKLLESFDFTVTQFVTDGKYFWMGESSYTDLLEKRLRWNVITYPASSLHRLTKYIKKGFTMREADYQEFVNTLWGHDSGIINEKLVYVD